MTADRSMENTSAASPRFRPADAADAALLDRALPADRDRGVTFVGFVADPRQIACAFAVAPTVERLDPPGLGLAVHTTSDDHVAPMLALARKMATSAKLAVLYAWPWPGESSAAARTYQSAGFEIFDRVTTWEMSARAAHASYAQLLDKLKRRSPDHPAWRANEAPLSAVDPDAVLKLYEARLATLGGLRDVTRARLTDPTRPDAFHPVLSRVLRSDGVVVAFMLVTLVGDVCTIRARAVEPAWEDGVANLRLFVAGLDADPPPPRRVLRFETHGRHVETLRLARRMSAAAIETRVKLRLRV